MPTLGRRGGEAEGDGVNTAPGARHCANGKSNCDPLRPLELYPLRRVTEGRRLSDLSHDPPTAQLDLFEAGNSTRANPISPTLAPLVDEADGNVESGWQ